MLSLQSLAGDLFNFIQIVSVQLFYFLICKGKKTLGMNGKYNWHWLDNKTREPFKNKTISKTSPPLHITSTCLILLIANLDYSVTAI